MSEPTGVQTTFKPDNADLRVIVNALDAYAAQHDDEDVHRLLRLFRGWQR